MDDFIKLLESMGADRVEYDGVDVLDFVYNGQYASITVNGGLLDADVRPPR